MRRRLRYETWYFVHLYAYLAIALAFSHQLATGTDFVGRPGRARLLVRALRASRSARSSCSGSALPLARSLLVHRLRVERVIEEAPGVVSVEIGGVRLDRLRARAGQFFTWRFLTRDRWWEAHPFSLSAAPDGRRLRITVKGLGRLHRARCSAIPPGTRVIAEGPFGSFTAAARRRPRVALIAGGVGITPIRALLEDMPGGPGTSRSSTARCSDDDVILRAELDELAGRRGVEVHYVLGGHDGGELLSPEHLQRADARHRRARRLRLRPARDDRGDAREPRPLRRLAPPHRHGAVRVLMRRAVAALVVTVAVVVLLARFETEPPRTRQPELRAGAGQDAARARRPPRRPRPTAAPARARVVPRARR